MEALGPGGGERMLVLYTSVHIWLPPLNQVSQAWNAQLCQTENSLSVLLMLREALGSFYSLLSMEVLTSQ